MLRHIIWILLLATVLVTAIFLPFLPGDYDSMAVPFSLMVQLAGFTGLPLAVIGLPWLVYELNKKSRETDRRYVGTYRFAMTALIFSSLMALGFALGAFATESRFLGFSILVFFGGVFVLLFRKVRQWKDRQNRSFYPAPVYLVCLPLLLVSSRMMFIEEAIAYSRAQAIKQSEQIIQDIETYYKNNGHYPVSMLSVNKDYKVFVIGIKQFEYELNGEAYNLFFEQFAAPFGTKEIVMYNKLDQHEMTSHDQDLLLLDASNLNLQRGYFRKYDLPQPHWKYFWFD